VNELDPPPSLVELVSKQIPDSIWKKWLYNLYEWLKENVSRDFFLDVNQGIINGYSSKNISGEVTGISNTEYDIWEGGGAAADLSWLTAATTLEAISSDANDTSAGTGARTIHVYGLDANFAEIDEVITMNGTSATTATTASFIRVNSVEVETVGTYTGSNIGNITIRVSSAGSTQSYISAGEGRDSNTHYTVPAGKTGYVIRISVTMDSNNDVDVHLVRRENADDSTAPVSPTVHTHHWTGIIAPVDETPKANHIFPAKSDIWAKGNKSTAGTCSIQVDYDIILVDN